MIKADRLTKHFGTITAIDHISAEIREGSVFGLIGTNGAGKSTFLKLASGILKPDEGSVTIDEVPAFEHPEVKARFFYISDDQHFFPNATPEEMMIFYESFYPDFDRTRFFTLTSAFGLDPRRKINTFSKGMKKQLSVILGLSAGTKYLFCDETFDGLDPVMRQSVKSLFAEALTERGFTPVIASHNLRELEDICDHVGLLHRGGILFSKDLDDLKTNLHKLQCVFRHNGGDASEAEAAKETDFVSGRIADGITKSSSGNSGSKYKSAIWEEKESAALKQLEILKKERRGSLLTLTVRGTEAQIRRALMPLEPVFLEMIPLSLEEIFISETEVNGYDIKSLIL